MASYETRHRFAVLEARVLMLEKKLDDLLMHLAASAPAPETTYVRPTAQQVHQDQLRKAKQDDEV